MSTLSSNEETVSTKPSQQPGMWLRAHRLIVRSRHSDNPFQQGREARDPPRKPPTSAHAAGRWALGVPDAISARAARKEVLVGWGAALVGLV